MTSLLLCSSSMMESSVTTTTETVTTAVYTASHDKKCALVRMPLICMSSLSLRCFSPTTLTARYCATGVNASTK